MKTVVAVVAVVLLLASRGAAQTPTPTVTPAPTATPAPEIYQVVATSPRVADMIQIVDMRNQKTCQRIHVQNGKNPWPVPYVCTQAEVCTATMPPITPCDDATSQGRSNLRQANARIYPNTFSGRDEFMSFVIAGPQFLDQINAVPSWQRFVQCIAWHGADAAARNQMCAQAGLSPDCRLYGLPCQ